MNYIRRILENSSREGYPEGKPWAKNDFSSGLFLQHTWENL